MAFFTGWHDASGSEAGSPVVVVAGVVALVEGWNAFAERWGSVLDEFGVSAFHRKKSKALWPGDHGRLSAFLDALATTLNADLQPTVVAVPRADYDAANRQYRIAEEFGGLYGVAQTVAVIAAAKRLRAERDPALGDLFEIFVEKGDAGQSAYRRMAEKIGFEPGILPSKNPATGLPRIPFQLADFIAGEHYAAWIASEKGGWPSPGSERFETLYRLTPIKSMIWQESAIVKLGDRFPR